MDRYQSMSAIIVALLVLLIGAGVIIYSLNKQLTIAESRADRYYALIATANSSACYKSTRRYKSSIGPRRPFRR